MKKVYDEDSLVAINKTKTIIALQESDLNALQESDLNLTNEILIDNNEMSIVIDIYSKGALLLWQTLMVKI